MINIARWFSVYRLLEDSLAREQLEVARLRAELLEWQNKTLQQARITPLFTPPPKPIEPVVQPPVGPTAKAAYLRDHASPNAVPTAEDILAQASLAKNGNG